MTGRRTLPVACECKAFHSWRLAAIASLSFGTSDGDAIRTLKTVAEKGIFFYFLK